MTSVASTLVRPRIGGAAILVRMPERSDARAPVGAPLRDELDAAMTRVGAGDQPAFAEVYDALAPRVFGLVLRVLVDRAQAEEVAQEVLLDIWRKAPSFDASRGSAVGWALQLAHSRAVDRVRSSQAQRDRDERIGTRDLPTDFDAVSEAADVRIESERVHAALEGLPAPQREALLLAYYGGLTQSEIAERLSTPLGTIKTRLRDGMIRLRAALGVT